MTFSVTILGSNSAAPASERFPSAQLINIQDNLFLVDCGEGTQMQLRRYKIKYQRINHVFISHLHGDHYLGLMGLIFTYHLLNRKNELHIHAPVELQNIINLQLKAGDSRLVYPLIFHPIEPESNCVIFENEILSVQSIPLVHRVPVSGFIFREKPRLRNINIDALAGEKPVRADFESIRRGEDFINPDGKVYKNSDITFAPIPLRSYAYCTDTLSVFESWRELNNIDLLYFETTFKHDLKEVAEEKYHSTTIQAATIAKDANVKKLIIGHFSGRYDNEYLPSFAEEAQTIFPNTFLALEGSTFDV